MFISKDIVYGGGPTCDLKVTAARATGDLCMLVTFSNGETRLFDGTCLSGLPVYAALADPKTFGDFEIDGGIITWKSGTIDIAPEYLYEHSYQYEIPA